MTSQTDPKTVELYGNGVPHEAEAESAITPGMLIERTSSGTVQPHSTGGAGGAPHFAKEYDLTGRGIDDAYADGDQVLFCTYAPGSGVYALLATGNNVTEGDFLVSNGAGALRAAAVDEVAFVQARESLNNTSGSNSRLKVEVVAPYRLAPA